MSKFFKLLILRWLPVFLWAAIIFIFSNNPDPYGYIPKGIYHWLWWTKLFGQSLIFYLGALGHIFEYTILSLLLARAMLWRGTFTNGKLFTVFYLTLLYAYTDEFHQVFTPGRAFQLADLLLDALGALVGIGAYVLYLRRAEVKKSRIVLRLRDAPLRLKNLKTKPK